MNLQIKNILEVIQHLTACNFLCLFGKEAIIIPESFNSDKIIQNVIDEIETLEEVSLDKIENLESYKAFCSEQSDCKFKIVSSKTDSSHFLLLAYFDNHNEDNSVIEDVKTLLDTITTIQNSKKDDYYQRLFEDMRIATDSTDEVIYAADPNNFKFNFISNSVQKIFGVSSSFIYKNKFTLLKKIYPNDIRKFKNFINQLRNGENSVVEYRYFNLDNTIGFIRHTGIPIIRKKKVVRIVGFISEITDEKQVFAKLKHLEKQFTLLMNTAAELIFTLDKSGYFLSINKNGANKLGYLPDKIIGKHFLEFVSDESKSDIAIAFQKIVSKNFPINFETTLVNKLGEKIEFNIKAASLKTDNKVSGMLGAGRDVSLLKKDETLFKQLNAKLTEANRIISIERDRAKEKISVLEELNRLKNDFISNVSHELRTPMASIVGFAETIATDSELPRETILEFNNIILTEGKRLAKLVNDILDFSRLESDSNKLQTTKIDLIEFLKELSKLFEQQAKNKNIIFSVELPEAEIFIEADRERLSKAVGNLISNAIKFTHAGGMVSIVAQEFLKEVEILIIDSGEGINSEDIPKLFQKFSKIDNLKEMQPGAGFGLVTAKQIVELHKGIIRVKSEVGKGSTFIIKLPKLN